MCDTALINSDVVERVPKGTRSVCEKEQRKVQRLEAALDVVNRRLKEQETRIEKVSAQIEIAKPDAQNGVE